MSRQYVDDIGFIDETGSLEYVGPGGLTQESISAGGTYHYSGPSTRANRYLGSRTDSQIYLGTKTGLFSP